MSTQDLDRTVELVRHAQGGDDRARERLFGRYRPVAVRIAEIRLGRRIRGHAEAEDVAHEALIHAFRSLDAFEHKVEGTFKNWLATIVENSVRDALRRGMAQKRGAGRVRNRSDLTDSTLTDSVFASADPTPSQVAHASELEDRIQDALQTRLDPSHREVIVLRNFCGMDYERIATELGVRTPNAARALHSRAVARLRELVKP